MTIQKYKIIHYNLQTAKNKYYYKPTIKPMCKPFIKPMLKGTFKQIKRK